MSKGKNQDGRALYDELVRRAREASLLESCSAVLGWDEQTYMPSGAAAHRGEQMALLAGLAHERATAPRMGELLEALTADADAEDDTIEAANVRQLKRDYDRQTKLPRPLVEEIARTTSLAQQEWIVARRESDYKRFQPWLERVVDLKRKESACVGAGLDARGRDAAALVYDPLLDEYEQGAETVKLRTLFEALRLELTPLVGEIVEAARNRPGHAGILDRSFPVDRQKTFGEAAAAALGFDFQRGRLDVSAHPFCTGIGPGDVRVTTRYDERQFGDAFFGVLHEVGHGLYEQGLPVEQYGAPAGEAASLGVHESQSRLWENAVGRSPAFWRYWFPMAKRVFHEALHDVAFDRFLAAINQVEPTLIRVQADEVTYNLHILIRFELEQALLTGDLAAADLPGAWNEAYRKTLGIVPKTDAQGCLQDVHWSAGLFGYFPTYTLGNVYAAQLFDQIKYDLPALDESFDRGEYHELLAWLRDKIHIHGQRYAPAALIERAVDGAVDPHVLVVALRRKYGSIYGL